MLKPFPCVSIWRRESRFWNPGNPFLWNPMGFGNRNPSSIGKESGIQCLESKIHGVESTIQDTRQLSWIPLHGATCMTAFCYPLLLSKLHWQRIGNSVPGIQNPWSGIQNPRHKTTVKTTINNSVKLACRIGQGKSLWSFHHLYVPIQIMIKSASYKYCELE